MSAILPAYPSLPSHTYTITLGALSFTLRYVFRPRLSAWYIDVFDAGGTALARSRRLSPGWSPLYALPIVGGPDGYLWVRGPDEYGRLDLGDSIKLVFYDSSVVTGTAAPTDVRVVLG